MNKHDELKILKLRDLLSDEGVINNMDTNYTTTFAYKPQISDEKFLISDEDVINNTFGCSWKDMIVIEVEDSLLEALTSKLKVEDDLLTCRFFTKRGSKIVEDPLTSGCIYKIDGTDVILLRRAYGFITKKINFPIFKKFIDSLQLKTCKYNEEDLSTVFWDSKTSQLKDDILFFSKSRKWFEKRELPYSRSYLLYGPPGNGKTSAIRAISKFFETEPSQFSFTAKYDDPDSEFIRWVSGNNEERTVGKTSNWYDDGEGIMFEKTVSEVKNENQEEEDSSIRILLLEDIDRFFSSEEGFKTPVSFSAILNALDGLNQRKNSIIIATANNPEKIDSQVLFRPGRFDLRIPFEAPDQNSMIQFLSKISQYDCLSDDVKATVAEKSKGHSFAFIKGIYMSAANKAFARKAEQICDEDVLVSMNECLANLGKDLKSSRDGAGFRSNR